MLKYISFIIGFLYTMFKLFIKTLIRKPFKFKGRSSRLEFFSFIFFSQVTFLSIYFIFKYKPDLLSKMEKLLFLQEPVSIMLFYVSIVFCLLVLVILYLSIGVCITARRLHDCNVNGVWSLLCFNGGFSPLLLIKGTPGPNKYGEPPVD